ncbi:unnamed protein product [Linum grandiflorum]
MWSLLISICHTAPLSFNFTNLNKCSDSIKLFGTATCGDSGVQLTSSDFYVTGQAHYSKPMRLWEASTGKLTSFNTTFTFSMDNNNGSYTFDGLAFFIASFNYTTPGRSGADGLLGLVDSKYMLNSKRVNPFVAVEFDTHFNSDWDSSSDVHVGIDINSIESVASKRWRSYANGITMSASVSYRAKNLCVEFTGLTESTEVGREQTEVKLVDVHGDTLCYEIDMKNYLTEWALFGFSASTSYMYQSHTLKTWLFSSDLDSEGVSSVVKSEVNKMAPFSWRKLTPSSVQLGTTTFVVAATSLSDQLYGMELRPTMITMLIWSVFISICDTAPLSFNYTNFDKCSDSIKLFETAACGDSGLELTKPAKFKTGQVHYSKPMRLWDASTGNVTNFNTNFTFTMDNFNGTYSCDGIAFFIASFNYTMLAGVNASYGLLGLVETDHMFNSKGNPFVAVEFDTFYNPCCDALTVGHVGIDVNSITSVANKMWRSYANGTTMSASVSYKDKNLCVEFTGINKTQTETVDVPNDTLCYVLDLKDYLTEWAVFGFSGSTGNYYQTQTLKTWSFFSDLDSEGGPNLVTSEVKKEESKKTTKSLIIGLAGGISSSLVILILATGTTIWTRNKKKSGYLHSDSGCRSPEGFLTGRKDRSSNVVKSTR